MTRKREPFNFTFDSVESAQEYARLNGIHNYSINRIMEGREHINPNGKVIVSRHFSGKWFLAPIVPQHAPNPWADMLLASVRGEKAKEATETPTETNLSLLATTPAGEVIKATGEAIAAIRDKGKLQLEVVR